MAYVKFGLCVLMALSLSSGSLSSVSPQSKRSRGAKWHLDRAMEFELWNDPRAEEEYKLAIKLRGGRYPKALRKLSSYLQGQLRFSEAAAMLEEYISQTPKEDHADDLEHLDKLKQAAVLQAVIDNSESPPLEDLLKYATLVARYGGFSKAAPYAERAVKVYPMSPKGYIALARLINPVQKERSLELLEKAVELEPNDAEAHSTRGWYYFWSARRVKEAEEDFQVALKLSSGQDQTAWHGMGYVYASRGQKKEAIDAFRTFLRVRKGPTQYDNEIGKIIEQLENALEREQRPK